MKDCTKICENFKEKEKSNIGEVPDSFPVNFQPKTCGGTWEVFSGCIETGGHKFYEPCPTCQPKNEEKEINSENNQPQEETLLVEIRWIKDRLYIPFKIGDSKDYVQVGVINKNIVNEGWRAYVNGFGNSLIGNNYENKEQAKQAVEKVFNITKIK
jgi:hypothetical protein